MNRWYRALVVFLLCGTFISADTLRLTQLKPKKNLKKSNCQGLPCQRRASFAFACLSWLGTSMTPQWLPSVSRSRGDLAMASSVSSVS